MNHQEQTPGTRKGNARPGASRIGCVTLFVVVLLAIAYPNFLEAYLRKQHPKTMARLQTPEVYLEVGKQIADSCKRVERKRVFDRAAPSSMGDLMPTVLLDLANKPSYAVVAPYGAYFEFGEMSRYFYGYSLRRDDAVSSGTIAVWRLYYLTEPKLDPTLEFLCTLEM